MNQFYQLTYEDREVEYIRTESVEPSLQQAEGYYGRGPSYYVADRAAMHGHIPQEPIRRSKIRRVKVTLELSKIDMLHLEEITDNDNRIGVFCLKMLYKGNKVSFENIPQEAAQELESAWMAWKNANPDGWRRDTADGLWENF